MTPIENEKTPKEEILLEALNIKKSLTTEEAATLLKVSPSTVRRIFIELAKKGSVIRIFGGICITESDVTSYSYTSLSKQQTGLKRRIAEKSVSMITSGDLIYLDGGTTVARLAQEVALKLKTGKLKNISIFTNSLVNLELLEQYCPVSLVGGTYRPNRKDTCGFLAEEALKSLHFTKCFLGADGFDVQNGFTTTDYDTARLNALAITQSENSYVLIDSKKFGYNAFVRYAKPSNSILLITDNELSNEQVAALKEADCIFHLC